jgi:hypothetical protein
MIRRGQLEEALGELPVADARIKPELASNSVRFLVTKDPNAPITRKGDRHADA